LKSRITSSSWLKPALAGVNNVRCQTWDLIHGVDTCGEIPLIGLDFHSKNKTAGLEYHSHHPAIIRLGLLGLPVQCKDYTFIDVGCGKGRVLLIASEFPFRRIIGLEFAPSLAEIAKRNLRSYRSRRQRCSNIEVVTGDALEYELPPEPQVLYFYSPFAPNILDQIVQRTEDSFQRSPRDLVVLFSGALSMRDRAFGSQPQYERLSRGRHIDIYRHRSMDRSLPATA
jgi:SAM-dependent methyltransferase